MPTYYASGERTAAVIDVSANNTTRVQLVNPTKAAAAAAAARREKQNATSATHIFDSKNKSLPYNLQHCSIALNSDIALHLSHLYRSDQFYFPNISSFPSFIFNL